MGTCCKKCGQEKPATEFRMNARRGGPRLDCRSCESIRNKSYRAEHVIKLAIKRKIYREKLHSASIIVSVSKTCSRCKTNKDRSQFAIDRSTKAGCQSRCKQCAKEIRDVKGISESSRSKKRTNRKVKQKTDPLFVLTNNIRRRCSNALVARGWNKRTTTELMLGCTFAEFRHWIESQWARWMSWSNYGNGAGQWNLDHVVPLRTAKDLTDLERLCHHSNIRPLSANINFSGSQNHMDRQQWV